MVYIWFDKHCAGLAHFWTHTLVVHRAIRKTLLGYPETFDLQTLSGCKAQSFAIFLGHFVSLFLDLFFEAWLTPPRCVSVSSMKNVVRMCQEWRRERKRPSKGREEKREHVIIMTVCFTFKTIYNLTRFLFKWSGSNSKAAHSKVQSRNTFNFGSLLFHTLTLSPLPMVTLEHTIFHVESCYRSVC